MNFSGRTIAVGVTGGIAAYKTCALVSLLKKAGADVYVAMTENAARFVSKLTFETLSGHRVVTDMWARDFEWEVEHISFAQRADIFVVAPCTLNMAGKLAAGVADDFLSTTLFAARCPVLLAPAMNLSGLVGSEMCIRDSSKTAGMPLFTAARGVWPAVTWAPGVWPSRKRSRRACTRCCTPDAILPERRCW